MIENMNDMQPVIAVMKEAMRIEEDARYASNRHMAEARRWRRLHLAFGIPATVAAALAGVSAIANAPFVAAALAIISAVSAGLLTFLNPKDNAAPHLKASAEFKSLLGRARMLREIDVQVQSIERAIDTLKTLDAERAALVKAAPLYSPGLYQPSIDESIYDVDTEEVEKELVQQARSFSRQSAHLVNDSTEP